MSAAVQHLTPEISVLDDRRCHLGEGATYDGLSDTAWWFDILEKTLFEHRFADGRTHAHPLPFMASQLSFIDDTAQLVASENGLYIRDIASGALKLHTPLEADNAATRSNDGRVHPCGALWIGTMGKAAERGAGAIYRFHHGVLTVLYSRITIPNAICFSPDGRIAYFTDTAENVLMRVATDPDTGMPTGETSVLHVDKDRSGGIDGAVVDDEGVIWNARWGASSVDAYSPEGRRVASIAVPATRPTCPAFVGPKLDRMLVTTARQHMTQDELMADRQAGATLVLTPGAIGRAEPRLVLGA